MTAAELAALVNGTIGHALDFDDTFANSVRYNLHPTTCVLPTAIALTESLKLSGRELLVAYIVGLEVEFRIGSAMGQLIPGSGWYPTPVLGTLGAAAAGAKALNLNASKSQSALGIAASLAGGMKKNVGTMTKAMHAGNGAETESLRHVSRQRVQAIPHLRRDHNFCEQSPIGK
jgi:2-methylcitrate dehydratase PrpD